MTSATANGASCTKCHVEPPLSRAGSTVLHDDWLQAVESMPPQPTQASAFLHLHKRRNRVTEKRRAQQQRSATRTRAFSLVLTASASANSFGLHNAMKERNRYGLICAWNGLTSVVIGLSSQNCPATVDLLQQHDVCNLRCSMQREQQGFLLFQAKLACLPVWTSFSIYRLHHIIWSKFMQCLRVHPSLSPASTTCLVVEHHV